VRVVFDTNILVSALMFPGGQGEKALLRIVRGEDQLLLSKPILLELIGVLGRKFDVDREGVSRLVVFLSELAELVQPTHQLEALDDVADNRILECAGAGRAEAIVSGDRALLRLRSFEGCRVVTSRSYLASRPAS